MIWVTAVLSLALAGAAAPPVPAALSSLLAKAGVNQPVAAWCQGEFRVGRRAYAVAVASGSGGRYLVIEPDAAAVELAPFSGGAELSCYTAEEARRIDRTIRQSEGIHGRVTPAFGTTVVCGFVEDTGAVCWQYSPVTRGFVKVGGWIT